MATVKEINTKKGDRMAFITLEDLKGSVEVISFSDVYKNASQYFSGDVPILVRGKVDKGEENIKVIASAVKPLEEAKGAVAQIVHIKADADKIAPDSLNGLKGVLSAHAGSSPVYLHLLWSDREVVMAMPDDLKVKPSEEFIKGIETFLGSGSCSIAQGRA